MFMEKRPYYITTAIAYASATPHIGNVYEIVLADAIARYKRFMGYDVFFQTGTDEHGQKIEEKAQKAGMEPQAYVDQVAGNIKNIWDLMNTSYDKFIRTTDKDHERKVQRIFKKLYDQGDIYKGAYEGMYCTPCESFFTASQLKDGRCPDCGGEVKPAREEAYFFKMSKYAPRLIDYINQHPEFIQPVARKNEMMNNFLLPGLQDLCVSRSSFKWGIPVDFDPKHVVYVWLDALTNYITGIGYEPDGESTAQFRKLWPADLHLIGKDIIRFHTIYWPIFLMALGEPLPKQVFGHPWLLQGGEKMSKTKGNVIYADDLVEIFAVFKRLNKYIDETEPWVLARDEAKADRLATVLYNLIEGITIGTALMAPFMPDTADKIVKMLNTEIRDFETLGTFGLYPSGTKVTDKPEILFARLKEADVMKEVDKIMAKQRKEAEKQAKLEEKAKEKVAKAEEKASEDADKAAAAASEQAENTAEAVVKKPEITIDDFAKMEFKVGEVIACEEVKKSKKLLCSKVKIGDEVRQIVSGIRKYYTAEEMVGKKVMVITNLKPAKLAGIMSEGMLLCAEGPDGTLALMTPEADKNIPDGAEIG